MPFAARTAKPAARAAEVLVLGGGLSGCALALRLAEGGVPVAIVEKSGAIGGKTRAYGCKATTECLGCGVCLTGGLFEKVEKHPLIEVLTNAEIWDIQGGMRRYTALVRTPAESRSLPRLAAVAVTTGFEPLRHSRTAHLEMVGTPGENILSGSQLEALFQRRGENALFQTPPESIALLGCFGSRDTHEDSFYCSRVCCAYTTRAARVIRRCHPACRVSYFYMELQNVNGAFWLEELQEAGVELIQSRPTKIKAGSPAEITFDHPQHGFCTQSYDLVVCSEGIHPPDENAHLAEIIGLSQDADGFLDAGPDGYATGLYVAGCARAPMRIEEAYNDAQRVAMDILFSLQPARREALV